MEKFTLEITVGPGDPPTACELLARRTGLFFRPQRQVFLVHRLDREAAGRLSRLFQHNLIAKRYQVEVLGNILTGQDNRIDLPLDGKAALTEYEALSYDPATNQHQQSHGADRNRPAPSDPPPFRPHRPSGHGRSPLRHGQQE
jgi:23S rRNA-/tRNA-specific pseudouridylate synthase